MGSDRKHKIEVIIVKPWEEFSPEEKEIFIKKIPKVEFKNPWRLFIIAGILNFISWGFIIWGFRQIFF